MPPPGSLSERLGPFTQQRAQIGLPAVELQLAALIFAEIENLVYKAVEYLDVLAGKEHEGVLLRGEIRGLRKLVNRLGNQCQRRAQVVRHRGVEYQFCLCGLLELAVQALLEVALLLKQAVLSHESLLVALALPESTQKQKQSKKQQHCYGYGAIEQKRLGRMALPVFVDLPFEISHFGSTVAYRLILLKQNIGVCKVNG